MPDEPSPRALHIASRMTELRATVKHFEIIASESKVPAEKADAEARVEVANAFLETLEDLAAK